MKKIFAIAAILSVFNIALAQQPDAVFKLIKHEWTVNSDGTSDYHYRHEVQIMRTRALTAYADKGETFVVYNPDIEELTVNEVYTIQADGRRVDMPKNAFVYQLPAECADCGRFNHMRELAMVHTGMEIGCVIVVDYTIHRRYNLICESIPLWRECPVEQFEVIVNYNHNDMELNYNIEGLQNLGLPENNIVREATVGTGDMDRNFHLTLRNLQQAPQEPYMPSGYIPTLHLRNGMPEFVPTFGEPAFNGASDAMGQTMISRNDRENLEAARNFFIDNIHLNDIDPKHLGYTHSTAAETWQSGCGTATDKANLLAAVLRAEGYRARVIGEQMDAVGVMVDTLEYRLDVRYRTPLTLIGEAKDEVDSICQTTTVDNPTLDTLEGGFFGLDIDASRGLIDARRLPMQRTTPLQAKACYRVTTTTYMLPKGVKMMGKGVSEQKAYEGVGSLEVSIKQSGRKLVVKRSLVLENSTVEPNDYAAYRDLLATWQSYNRVLLK